MTLFSGCEPVGDLCVCEQRRLLSPVLFLLFRGVSRLHKMLYSVSAGVLGNAILELM